MSGILLMGLLLCLRPAFNQLLNTPDTFAPVHILSSFQQQPCPPQPAIHHPTRWTEYIDVIRPFLDKKAVINRGFVIEKQEPFTHSVEVMQLGDQEVLWLQKFVCRDGPKPYGETLDVLVLPVRSEEKVLFTSSCKLNGTNDNEIIAVGTLADDRFSGVLHVAWRASRDSQRFESIPLDGVSCDIDGPP